MLVVTCNTHQVKTHLTMAEAASGMPVRSAHAIMANHEHCACVVNCDHSDCATNPYQSHHSITTYYTSHAPMCMHAANTRLNRVARMFCAGISAADHLLRGGGLLLLRCAAAAVTV